jgi:hypothetical protein
MSIYFQVNSLRCLRRSPCLNRSHGRRHNLPRAKAALSTSRLMPHRNRTVARRRFGGIDLYAYGDEELAREIATVRAGIFAVVKESGPLAPSLIRYLAAKRTDREISQRVFSALLGAELRSGRLDGVVCESETGKAFRIVVEADMKPRFETFLRNCLDMVPSSGRLTIASVRDRLYPGEKEGNWTRAYYLASRLARIGLVDFVDRFNIVRSKDAYHAISSIDESLYSSDHFRLD